MNDGRTDAARVQDAIRRMWDMLHLGMPFVRLPSDDLALFVTAYERLKAENNGLVHTNIYLQTELRKLRDGAKQP